MPRSSSPHAYPTVYFQMLEAFERSQMPLHVQCNDSREANNKRNEWHSFVRSLEKSGDERMFHLSKVARGRVCKILEHDPTIISWQSRDLQDYATSLTSALQDFEEDLEATSKLVATDYDKAEVQIIAHMQETHTGETSIDLLDDFMAEPEEDQAANQLFEDFMSESEQTILDDSNEKSLLGLLDQPVPPIHTRASFSQEIDDPNQIENIKELK